MGSDQARYLVQNLVLGAGQGRAERSFGRQHLGPGHARLAGNLGDIRGRWTYVELLGKTGPEQSAVAVLCRLGFYRNPAKGLALFDDFKVEELAAAPAIGYDTVDLSENVDGAVAVMSNGPFKMQAPPGFVPLAIFYGTGAVLAAVAIALIFSLPVVAAGARRRAASREAARAPAEEWRGPYRGVEHRRSPRSPGSPRRCQQARPRPPSGKVHIAAVREPLGQRRLSPVRGPAALGLPEEVTIEAALPTGVLRLGTGTVVGVRTRWDAQASCSTAGSPSTSKRAARPRCGCGGAWPSGLPMPTPVPAPTPARATARARASTRDDSPGTPQTGSPAGIGPGCRP